MARQRCAARPHHVKRAMQRHDLPEIPLSDWRKMEAAINIGAALPLRTTPSGETVYAVVCRGKTIPVVVGQNDGRIRTVLPASELANYVKELVRKRTSNALAKIAGK